MRLFDNHCHLGYKDQNNAVPDLERARAAGVVGFINVGTNAAHSRRAIEIAAQHPDVWATVGLHPHDATEGVDSIVGLLGAHKVVAIGECGLDYHYDHSPRQVQRSAFTEQIDLANAHDLPLVIHTREAWDDTFELLDRCGVPRRTIFHCFTSGPEEATECLRRGAYLSFSGIVTFKNSSGNREAAGLCPLDRLLTETDSPYLSPVPHRGHRNEPAFVRHVVEAVANSRNADIEMIAEATVDNAMVAFGLAPT